MQKVKLSSQRRLGSSRAAGPRHKDGVTILYLIILSIFFTPAYAVEDSEETMNIQSVTILAASSVTVPVTEIAKLYSRKSGIDVNTVYEDSDELLKRIEEGDPADIIVTPNKDLIEKMKAEGLVDASSIKIVAGNSLNIVASKKMVLEENPDIKNILQQIHNKALIIIADPSTTALGETSRESLQKLKMWPQFENRAVLAPTSSKAIDLIIKGESAGIVYATDAKLYADKINNFGAIPASMHKPVVYYVAIVVSDNMDHARETLKFFESKTAKNIFKTNGFDPK